jgi:hypothetical protein
MKLIVIWVDGDSLALLTDEEGYHSDVDGGNEKVLTLTFAIQGPPGSVIYVVWQSLKLLGSCQAFAQVSRINGAAASYSSINQA